MRELIPQEMIETKIFVIRGQKVMLSPHLAGLYGIDTKYLNRAVRRNSNRFPDDFMFQLNQKEMNDLRCQFGTSKWGGRRYLPYAFTEQGVAMLSTVINSEKAIQVNIAIMRAFVKLRQIVSVNKDLAAKLEELERRVGGHDAKIQAIFEAIKRLTMPLEPRKEKRRIGFSTEKN